MNSIGDLIDGLNDLALYRSISNYVDARIAFFTESTLANVFTIVGAFALILLTLWILWYGYQMVMGNSQNSAKDFVFKAVRAWIIIAFATGLAATSGFSVRTITTDLTNAVSQTLAGDNRDNQGAAARCLNVAERQSFMGCKIDQNLIRTQAAMAFVNQIDTANDPVLEDKKARASLFAAVGVGGPAIVAGAMLLTLKVAMALFICLGPIFIMCLLFKVTTPLFQKWLYYGISTMFATAMLAVVSDIAMDLVENISGALFVTNIVASVLGDTASNTAGVMQAATQQLGLGLILSTLLITTPPMAASFFNGVMGQFSSYNQLGGMGVPASGVPPSSSGGYSSGGASSAPANPAPVSTNTQTNGGIASPQANPAQQYIPSNNAAVNKDVIKPSSDIGNASKGFASNEVVQADRTIKDPSPPPKVENT